MKMLVKQEKLQPQFKSYQKFLCEYEQFTEARSSLFAKQLQDFTLSGITPKVYFEKISTKDERAAETFLLNYKHFVQFQTNQYFGDLHQLRWELGRKHKKGGF